MTGKVSRHFVENVENVNGYLFQPLSFEAECFIVQQTIQCMNTRFIALLKE